MSMTLILLFLIYSLAHGAGAEIDLENYADFQRIREIKCCLPIERQDMRCVRWKENQKCFTCRQACQDILNPYNFLDISNLETLMAFSERIENKLDTFCKSNNIFRTGEVGSSQKFLDVLFELDAKTFYDAFLVLRKKCGAVLLEASYIMLRQDCSLDPIYAEQYHLLLSAFQAYSDDNKEVAERKYNIWRLTHLQEHKVRDFVMQQNMELI